MKQLIKLILSTDKESNARRVLAKLNHQIPVVDPVLSDHHSGGIEVQWNLELKTEEWSDAVLKALETAQNFGRAWTIHGNVGEALDLVSSQFSVAGIEFAQITVSKQFDSSANHSPGS